MAALHQFIAFLMSFLVSGTFVPPSTNNGTGGWYNILNQITLRNRNLEREFHRVDAEKNRLVAENKQLVERVAQSERLTKSQLNNIITLQRLLNGTRVAREECETALNSSQMANERYATDLTRLRSQNDQCQAIAAKFPSNCAAWKKAGYNGNGKYVIDPDGPGGVAQFSVECVMNGPNGEAITVMHHDSEARIHAGNCEAKHSCVRNVKYQASLQQIIALIGISRECKQFIKYDCRNSYFGFGNPKYDFHAWFSRHGTAMDYWGGATPGSKKCACGMLNSCDKPGLACNCDANDLVWRSDSGYLSDKATLPVTKMAFGDLGGSDEDGYHRLGALQCFGSL